MKVTVKVYLNVRVGKPSVNAPCFQYLAPGSVIEVEDKLYPGDKYDGIHTWYRDDAGNYYWSGGVERTIEKVCTIDFKYNENLKPSWMSGNFDVSPFWSKTTGKGITVAVIDSGIYFHEDLKDCIDYENMKSFIGDSIEDEDGHGTHVAGIIGARGRSDIIGVAPGVKILPIKVVRYKTDKINNKVLINAINYAASIPAVRIINLSFGANINGEYINELRLVVKDAINIKMKILVAASGNDSDKAISSPADFDNVFAVSALKRVSDIPEKYIIPDFGNCSDRVNICCIGYDIISCAKEETGTIIKDGTSMAAAYMSGLTALKIQLLGTQNEPNLQNDISNAIASSIFERTCREDDSNISLPIIFPKIFLNL